MFAQVEFEFESVPAVAVVEFGLTEFGLPAVVPAVSALASASVAHLQPLSEPQTPLAINPSSGEWLQHFGVAPDSDPAVEPCQWSVVLQRQQV